MTATATPAEPVVAVVLAGGTGSRLYPASRSDRPKQFLPLFEAARWAPSAYNNQHWRFLYATRDDEEWETFFDLLNEANQTWASEAGVLVVILAKTTFDHNGESAPTHSFDTGAAWQNLALEATRRDLVAHPMAGFDWGRVHGALDVPEDEFAKAAGSAAATLKRRLNEYR